MSQDWQELTRLTGSSDFTVTKVRLADRNISIEGDFGLPPLARLSGDDQIFVAAFVRCHGSIKDMEQLFGVSYPTVKNRLNRISQQLEFVEVNPAPTGSELLQRIERGEITAKEALEMLKSPPKSD
jgi:hypothetical protein